MAPRYSRNAAPFSGTLCDAPMHYQKYRKVLTKCRWVIEIGHVRFIQRKERREVPAATYPFFELARWNDPMIPNLTLAPNDVTNPISSQPGIASPARTVAASQTEILTVKNLSKIFGAKPERAQALLKQGLGRNEIFAQTGNMVAVDDVSLAVNA